MNLQNIINNLTLTTGSAMMNCEIHIVLVNAYNKDVKELFNGTAQEMIDHAKAGASFGTGLASEWCVVGYNYVAYNIADEEMPVFTRPIEIRVI